MKKMLILACILTPILGVGAQDISSNTQENCCYSYEDIAEIGCMGLTSEIRHDEYLLKVLTNSAHIDDPQIIKAIKYIKNHGELSLIALKGWNKDYESCKTKSVEEAIQLGEKFIDCAGDASDMHQKVTLLKKLTVVTPDDKTISIETMLLGDSLKLLREYSKEYKSCKIQSVKEAIQLGEKFLEKLEIRHE